MISNSSKRSVSCFRSDSSQSRADSVTVLQPTVNRLKLRSGKVGLMNGLRERFASLSLSSTRQRTRLYTTRNTSLLIRSYTSMRLTIPVRNARSLSFSPISCSYRNYPSCSHFGCHHFSQLLILCFIGSTTSRSYPWRPLLCHLIHRSLCIEFTLANPELSLVTSHSQRQDRHSLCEMDSQRWGSSYRKYGRVCREWRWNVSSRYVSPFSPEMVGECRFRLWLQWASLCLSHSLSVGVELTHLSNWDISRCALQTPFATYSRRTFSSIVFRPLALCNCTRVRPTSHAVDHHHSYFASHLRRCSFVRSFG